MHVRLLNPHHFGAIVVVISTDLRMRKLLFFGDSLTAGYGLASPDSESYPALLQQKIHQDKLDFLVINAGLSGDTSSGGLARLDRWLINPIDGFILELGVNDFMRGLPATATYNNLDKILFKVSKKYPDCKLAIMGMEVPDFISSPRISEFRGIFRRLAEKYNATFVPFFLEGVAGMRPLNLKDGIHPSAKGYSVIANRVWPTIKSLLVADIDQKKKVA
jgi:acyl-CoA thioesterase-1